MECYLHSIIFSRFPRQMSIVVSPRRGLVLRAHDIQRFYEIAHLYDGLGDVFTELYVHDGGVHVDKIVFDIDGPDLEKAFIELLSLRGFLDRERMPYILVFSGSKGFHVYIPVKHFVANDETARLAIKSMQDYIASSVGLRYYDKHLVGTTRHWIRVPGTRNMKSKRYSSFLDPLVRELSRVYEASHTPICPDYRDVLSRRPPDPREYVGKTIEYYEHNNPPPRPLITISHEKGDVARFLEPLLRPCVYKWALTTEPSHFIRTQFALELCWLGFTEEEIVEIISRLNWEDYEERITRYHVRKICDKAKAGVLKPASCKTIRDKGYCLGEKCPFYPGYFYWWGLI